jgi:hypothetical protein
VSSLAWLAVTIGAVIVVGLLLASLTLLRRPKLQGPTYLRQPDRVLRRALKRRARYDVWTSEGR